MTLEKRGYILATCWTPECTVEHPEAVLQLANEYARAGADVTQTCTFRSDDNRLKELHGESAPLVRHHFQECQLNTTYHDFSVKKSINQLVRLPSKLARKKAP